MNNFLIEPTPKNIARALDDKRLFAQAKEAVQMCATACAVNGNYILKPDGLMFGTSHERHPVTVWTGLCQDNYMFTLKLAAECLNEHGRRFNHNLDYYQLSSYIPQCLAFKELFPVHVSTEYYPLAMPAYIKEKVGTNEDGEPVSFTKSLRTAVIAYRIYWTLEKTGGKYTNASPPEWIGNPSLMAQVDCPPEF